jgi:hypothetical protein
MALSKNDLESLMNSPRVGTPEFALEFFLLRHGINYETFLENGGNNGSPALVYSNIKKKMRKEKRLEVIKNINSRYARTKEWTKKYYQEKLVPFYQERIIPFYQEELKPFFVVNNDQDQNSRDQNIIPLLLPLQQPDLP